MTICSMSAAQGLFQSLIGILAIWKAISAADASEYVSKFQSLIGILAIWKSAWLKSLLYWVFKVHLRESPAIIAFQEGNGQYTTCSNPVKTSSRDTFRICANPCSGVRAFHSWCDKGCSPKFRSFTKNTNPFARLKNTSTDILHQLQQPPGV